MHSTTKQELRHLKKCSMMEENSRVNLYECEIFAGLVGGASLVCFFALELLHDMNTDDCRHHDDQTNREHDSFHLTHRDTSRDEL